MASYLLQVHHFALSLVQISFFIYYFSYNSFRSSADHSSYIHVIPSVRSEPPSVISWRIREEYFTEISRRMLMENPYEDFAKNLSYTIPHLGFFYLTEIRCSDGINTTIMDMSKVDELKGNNDTMSSVQLYFDGGCAPNPGRMSSCIVICRPGEKAEALTMKNLGQGTNNVAEWSALIWAVLWAKDNGIKKCVIFGDSKLVINQAAGLWKINNELLANLFKEFKQVSEGIDLELRHVFRDSNLAGIYLEHGAL